MFVCSFVRSFVSLFVCLSLLDVLRCLWTLAGVGGSEGADRPASTVHITAGLQRGGQRCSDA